MTVQKDLKERLIDDIEKLPAHTKLPSRTELSAQEASARVAVVASMRIMTRAMQVLKAKLYELELQKRNAKAQAVEDTKSDIGWGSQIRSYVLDQSRIKDLRTGVEIGNTQAVLDGDLDEFIEASLKSGL